MGTHPRFDESGTGPSPQDPDAHVGDMGKARGTCAFSESSLVASGCKNTPVISSYVGRPDGVEEQKDEEGEKDEKGEENEERIAQFIDDDSCLDNEAHHQDEEDEEPITAFDGNARRHDESCLDNKAQPGKTY